MKAKVKALMDGRRSVLIKCSLVIGIDGMQTELKSESETEVDEESERYA